MASTLGSNTSKLRQSQTASPFDVTSTSSSPYITSPACSVPGTPPATAWCSSAGMGTQRSTIVLPLRSRQTSWCIAASSYCQSTRPSQSSSATPPCAPPKRVSGSATRKVTSRWPLSSSSPQYGGSGGRQEGT